ncbi:MAG: hypothetical protein KCHDKBKB_01480 [Elusimicrobia bacterium]|nr:hypothetical protein [Elusimicrobiota bacterium]
MRIQTVFLTVILSPALMFAGVETSVGTRGFPLLSTESTARMTGMGRAHGAVADDVQVVFTNPAGLGLSVDSEFILGQQAGVESISTSHAGVVLPLNGITAGGGFDFGALGISLSHLEYGDLNGRDVSGNATGTFSPDESVLGIGYGRYFYGGVSAGAKLKFFQSTIDNSKADGSTADIGFLFQPQGSIWTTGVTFQNISGEASYESASVKLPEMIIMGIAVRPFNNEQLLISADTLDPKDDSYSIRTGMEWWMSDVVALRVGYDSSDDGGSGFTTGLGFQIRNLEVFYFPVKRFRLDYAFSSANNLSVDDSASAGFHQVSLSFQFGEDNHASE